MSKRSVIWSLFQKHSFIWWPTLPFKNFSSLHLMCMKFSDSKRRRDKKILSSGKHFCHWEISEILLCVRGLDLCTVLKPAPSLLALFLSTCKKLPPQPASFGRAASGGAVATSGGKTCLDTGRIGFCFCALVLQTQIPKLCTNLDLSLLYILILGTYSTFARKNNFLALGVCFPQPCSSTGRIFAASR